MALKRVLGGGSLNAWRGLENFYGGNVQQGDDRLQDIHNYLESKGIRNPTENMPRSRRSDFLLNALGGDIESLQPQSAPERIAQDLISTAVQYGIGGGKPNLKSFKPAAAGSIAGSISDEMGLPPAIGNIARVGTEFGFNRSALKKEGRIPQSLGKHAENLYKKTEQSLTNNNAGRVSPKLRNFFKKVDNLDRTQPNAAVREEVYDLYNTIQNNKNKDGSYDILNLWETNKNLGKQYSKASSEFKPYIQQAREGIKQSLKYFGRYKNKEFGQHWEDAADVWGISKTNGIIKDFANAIPRVEKIGFLQKLLGKIGGPSPMSLLKRGGRRYYGDLLKAAINEDKSAFLRAGKKLSDQEDFYEPEQEIRYRIIE